MPDTKRFHSDPDPICISECKIDLTFKGIFLIVRFNPWNPEPPDLFQFSTNIRDSLLLTFQAHCRGRVIRE